MGRDRKTRPVVIVSPDEMNARLHTVLVAPLTAGGFTAPFRVPCRFAGVNG
jgi:mRNA-degrading endonuclease toxin of MazEF toxin-antitoxin module